MKGDGVAEGKKWYAVYLTPKIVKMVIEVVLLVCFAALALFVADFFQNASEAMDAAIAEGLVPRIVKDYATGCMALCAVPILFIVWRMKR